VTSKIIGSAGLRRGYRGAAGLLALFGAAQLALWVGRVDPTIFPPPSAILVNAVQLATNGSFIASIGSTMGAWAIAMAIAVVIAVPVGLLLGTVRWAERALLPLIEFLRPFPAVVLIPLVLLIVQDDTKTEVLIIVYAAVWPVLINTIYGVQGVNQLAKDTLRSFGFGPLSIARRVSLPSAAPFAATGVRIAASVAFVVAVAVGLIGSGLNGIGAFTLAEEGGTGDIAILIAVAIWAGLIGLAINAFFAGAERLAFRWHFALAATSQGQP
jgi:NitT/TauT family transport system permease protein